MLLTQLSLLTPMVSQLRSPKGVWTGRSLRHKRDEFKSRRIRGQKSSLDGAMSDWKLNDQLLPDVHHFASIIIQHCQNYGLIDVTGSEGNIEFIDSQTMSNVETGHDMKIENRFYANERFRKVHLELGLSSSKLNVLHCVFFPRHTFNLPILSLEMIGVKQVFLVVADLCPISSDLSLSPEFIRVMRELKEGAELGKIDFPEWGKEVFSQEAVFLRPDNPKDISNFIQYASSLIEAFLKMTEEMKPDQALAAIVREGHIRYCNAHLRNKKTQRALTQAFGEQFADNYMRNVVFNPYDDPNQSNNYFME